MYQKSSDLRKHLIISIYIDFLRFYFPFFCIHWLMGYDVKADGKVLIKAGTPVQLQVERTKRRGVGRPGSLTVKPLTTTSVDGQTIVLSGGTLNVEGKKRTGKAVGLGVGLGVGLLCPPLLACLAIKGDHAVIESSTIMNNVFVANEYTIE